jgi:hypothetical protein
VDQRPVRSTLTLDPQTARQVCDPNSVYEVHERTVEGHLRTLRKMGWITKAAMLSNAYHKTMNIDRLLAEGRATPI